MKQESLSSFVARWKKVYIRKVRACALFDARSVTHLTSRQRTFLAQSLYHVRGHFYPFLWFSGSLAPSSSYKSVVLDNFSDEFGGHKQSHELLYEKFAYDLGVKNIFTEVIDERAYHDFVRIFVHKQLSLILKNQSNWPFVWAAYSAVEALDTIDYAHLAQMATGLGISADGFEFFKVHTTVRHYELSEPLLEPLWEIDPVSVRKAFFAIARLQSTVWQKLSAAVFAYR